MGNELNILQIILHSGIVVKGVLLILVAASILSWAIMFRKRKEFKLIEENNKVFLKLYLESKNLRDVLTQSKEMSFSPFSIMFNEGYEELLKITEKLSGQATKELLHEHFVSFGLDSISRGLKKGSLIAIEKMEHLQSLLASIGSVAPYIGLFGTVWGIINSFTGLASGGSGLENVAPGIAEALVATAVGLFAAIPAVLSYNYFGGQIITWQNRMESFEQDFLNMVERSVIFKK